MKGFDPTFKDLPDYIDKITDEIWEGRSVGPGIRRYYGKTVPVRSPSGVITGADAVVAATLQTLHEFPDRRLLGEDVVWSGDDQTGFLSSHRILSTATCQGRQIRYRVIADCACLQNQVIDEWLVRDQGAIAVSMGITAKEMAEQQARADMEAHGAIQFFNDDCNVDGPYKPVIQTDPHATSYADKLMRIWNEADLRAIRELYSWSATLNAPGGQPRTGHTAIDQFYLGYLAAFPNAKLTIDHLISRTDPSGPTRLAVRFHIDALHTGQGRFGQPTGQPAYIMGIAQAHIQNGQITQEWLLLDEVAIFKQLISI